MCKGHGKGKKEVGTTVQVRGQKTMNQRQRPIRKRVEDKDTIENGLLAE